jgi:glycosyltransferase involved in cell wall biosynthesis
MNIVFDYQIFFLQKYGGISRYYCHLAEELAGLNQNPIVLAPFFSNQHIDYCAPYRTIGYHFNTYPPKTTRILRAANIFTSALITQFIKPNIIHETYYSKTPIYTQSTPRVVTVYDMIHELFHYQFPKDDPTSELKKLAVSHAEHVICISHCTKRDLCQLFDIPEEKVKVVHLACSLPPPISIGAPIPKDKPFLLYVGNRSSYKNFSTLLYSFAKSPLLRKNFRIIAFGGGCFTEAEKYEINRLGISENDTCQVSGNDSTLAFLYREATAFIYPSLYEGFGLPLLEAMSFNCPVIASNTSSIPEVVGTAAEMFDPNSVEDMTQAIERVVTSRERTNSLKILGAERLKHFSWRKCAEETLEVYNKVI